MGGVQDTPRLVRPRYPLPTLSGPFECFLRVAQIWYEASLRVYVEYFRGDRRLLPVVVFVFVGFMLFVIQMGYGIASRQYARFVAADAYRALYMDVALFLDGNYTVALSLLRHPCLRQKQGRRAALLDLERRIQYLR